MSANQRFVFLLMGMLLIGVALMKVAPAQRVPAARTIVADQFIAGSGSNRAVLDAEGLVVTGQQGIIKVQTSGRFTDVEIAARSGAGRISMQIDGREGSVPFLVVEGKKPEQNFTIMVTPNGPKIVMSGRNGKTRIITP